MRRYLSTTVVTLATVVAVASGSATAVAAESSFNGSSQGSRNASWEISGSSRDHKGAFNSSQNGLSIVTGAKADTKDTIDDKDSTSPEKRATSSLASLDSDTTLIIGLGAVAMLMALSYNWAYIAGLNAQHR